MKIFELQEILSRFDPNIDIQINISDLNQTIGYHNLELDEEYDEESCVLEVILPNDTYLEQCTNSLEDRCD